MRPWTLSRPTPIDRWISELVKICALASAFDTPVVAHGHSLLAALHVAGAQSPTVAVCRIPVQYQETKQFFHQPIYRPEKALQLPELAGLGIVLDECQDRIPPGSKVLIRLPHA
jgi:L-alanine-DL-glutamate epimerase-like enolase superfamily enzyme